MLGRHLQYTPIYRSDVTCICKPVMAVQSIDDRLFILSWSMHDRADRSRRLMHLLKCQGARHPLQACYHVRTCAHHPNRCSSQGRMARCAVSKAIQNHFLNLQAVQISC